jgi:TatA/E family protein of Tat protein translocase
VPFDGAFSPLHWLIVAVVALLVLGPDQLPAFAQRAGEAMRDLRRVREHLGSELRDLVSEFDLDQTPDAGSPAPPKHDDDSSASGLSVVEDDPRTL